MMLDISSEAKILVVAPHPDDESLGAGGFMLVFPKQVDSFCFLSSGVAPHAKEKSETRVAEWNAAQQFIGCNNLGIVELYGEKPLLPKIAGKIPEYMQRLNTAQYDYIFMPHIKDNHPDHQYISSILMRKILIENGYKKNLKIVFFEVWSILESPNTFFEINPQRKSELLALYSSQWQICNLPKKILGLNCYRGVCAGFKDYVEAFEVVSINEYLENTAPIEEITENKDEELRKRIYPNFISNRFDLLYGNDYELYDLGIGVVPVKIEGKTAKLGMTLMSYPDKTLDKFYNFLFEKKPFLESLKVSHSLSPYGISTKDNSFYHYPYWHIKLPKTQQEFDETLAARVRYNTKWYPKKIRENLGSLKITRLTVHDTTDDIVQQFFKWKKLSHNCDYHMTAGEYLKTYGISETYCLYISQELVSVGFTCTTEDNVYFEQFAYSQDEKYRKYSLDMVLYYGIICDLIAQGRKFFYLSGGWLDYKKRYNGTCQYTYSGYIFKNRKKKFHHSLWWHIKHFKF